MSSYGAMRLYAKTLTANDNSKNQVYLGGDFSALNILPHQEILTDSDSKAGSKRDRAKAKVSFFWVDPEPEWGHSAYSNFLDDLSFLLTLYECPL